MKNINKWKPGKFILKKDKLFASSDPAQIASSSRFIADIQAKIYQSLQVKSCSFNTILLTDVLEHIEKPDILFSEISRMLKKDGLLLLTVPFFYPIHEEPYDFHRYTEYKIKSLCIENSLSIEELYPYAGLVEFSLHVINYLNSFSRITSFLSYWLTTGTIKLPYVKYLSDKTSKRFPLGYTLVAKKI